MGESRDREAATPLARVHVLADRAATRRSSATGPDQRPPGLRVSDGRVVELDGRDESDFDVDDAFIARHGLDLAVAEEAMALDEVTFGRMTVHPAVPAEELARLAAGMTPAKLAAALAALRPPELAMAAHRLVPRPSGDPDRPAFGHEMLVIVPLQATRAPRDGETPWSTAMLVASYAARGLRSRVVTGGSRARSSAVPGREALRPLVSRVVLARAIGAWGVAPARLGDAGPRSQAEEVVAVLLGLDARPAARGVPADDDFGPGAEGLRTRAEVLAEAGRAPLAGTLRRAAELVALDDAEVDRLCRVLRPGEPDADLTAEATALRDRGATACAAFLDEAAAAYQGLGLDG
ncbi:MAG TPA: propanediol/glycerol family dehydratase large subunit [Nocardioides sp.]|nr:propanediol/glycerol family dehydratase large subunit [Nocardioides sp.]